APAVVASRQAYARGLARAHVALGRRLASLGPAGGSPVLAMSDCGAAPYYSGWSTVDLYGLNDPAVARTGRHDAGAVLRRHPDVVVLVSQRAGTFVPFPWNLHEVALLDSCVRGGMTRVKTLGFDPRWYFLWVLARPGSEVARGLAAWQVDP
ncbi:MAG: hypothetical protein HZC42_11065, partial [Candidatus Eisenbacteria bacterium]|nr:hypothetical protein [Candidatus Eisenbacteria bacterium]